MTLSDGIILYLSLGMALAFATRSIHSDSSGKIALDVLRTSLLWPFLLSRLALEVVRRRFRPIDEMSEKKSSIREALAGILESEKPGISLVRAREVIDWYTELAEAVNEMNYALGSGVEFFPELISVSGKSRNHISGAALERKNLRIASKHLRIARECLVEEFIGSEFLQPAERDRRKRLLQELSSIVGDYLSMAECLDVRLSSNEENPLRIIRAGKADTASVEG